MTTTASNIELEIQQLQAAILLRRNDNLKDEKSIHKLEVELHKQSIAATLGIVGGVRTRYRRSDRKAGFDDTAGTVTAIRRTRADVDFGEFGKWVFPIGQLLAASSGNNQGFFFEVPS